MPSIEKIVLENRISLEVAKQIIATYRVPYDLGQYLGLVPQPLPPVSHHHSGISTPTGTHMLSNELIMSQYNSHSASPLHQPTQQPQQIPLNFSHRNNNSNLGHYTGVNSINLVNCLSGINTTNNFNNHNSYNNSNSNSACPSPIFSNSAYSGCSSPITSGGGFGGNNVGGSSPMHQITRGISVLNTGGGSISRGTSSAATTVLSQTPPVYPSFNEPLDLSMDVVNTPVEDNSMSNYGTSNWYVPPNYYDSRPLNLSPANQVQRIVPTPPTSPNLCIIQEENYMSMQPTSALLTTTTSCDVTTTIPQQPNTQIQDLHPYPQICLTDVQGSEITLVALSDSSSRDSDDSLDGQNTMSFQGLLITEPSSDMPSITRGVGRKASLENENNNSPSSSHINPNLETEQYARRGSDKSLGFSDDSLSNDSNHSILSPSQEPSASSGFKSGDSHSEIESRLSPDSLSDVSRRLSDEYYELPLPYECSNLDSSRILELVKKTIDSKMPPKGFTINNNRNQDQPENDNINSPSSSSSSTASQVPVDVSNLNLEYSGGLQIELQVCEGRNKDMIGGKGIKLRRISGDQYEYGKLCQQLITSLTV